MMTPDECRDAELDKLFDQFECLKISVKVPDDGYTNVKGGVTGITDEKQKRVANLHDDLAISACFNVGYWRLLQLGKIVGVPGNILRDFDDRDEFSEQSRNHYEAVAAAPMAGVTV